MYTDGEYVEAYAEDSSNGNSVSGGVDGQQGGSTSTSRFNAMYAVAAAAAVATLVGAFLMKKNVSPNFDFKNGMQAMRCCGTQRLRFSYPVFVSFA